MQYLPLETCKHLVSLGCTSESGFKHVFYDWNLTSVLYEPAENLGLEQTPAFSLEDLLRKENAELIWPGYDTPFYLEIRQQKLHEVVDIFQSHPDTWPEEISKMITPKAEEGGEDKEG